MQLRCARNGNHPRLLREDPRERDLRRRRLLLCRDPADKIHHSLICYAVLWREARDNIAEVRLIELGLFVDFAREKTFPQGTEWDEADAELLERWQDFRLRLSPPL